jgi:hypothetical protein
MRTILPALGLTLILAIAPTAVLAYCPAIASADAVRANASQQQLIACQQAELDNTAKLRQQTLDLQAALQAQQRTFELQLRLQQTFTASQSVATLPQF